MADTERTWFKWIVLAAGIYTNVFVFSVLFSFGSMFSEVQNKFRESVSRTAMVHAMLIGFGLSSGIFTGILLSRFGMRTITIVGGIMASMGFILSFLATSILHLYICISVITGIGTSLMIISSTTAISQSFSGSQRLLALAIQHTGLSVGGALTPYLYEYFLENYGLNGTFLLIGGINLNCLPAALLFSIPNQKRVKETNKEPKQSHNTAIETRRRSTTQVIISVVHIEMERLKTDINDVIHTLFILTVLGIGLMLGSLGGFNSLLLDILQWKGLQSNEALFAFPTMYGVGFLGRVIPGIAKQFKGVSSFVCLIIFGICGVCGQLIFVLLSGTLTLMIGCAFLGLAIAGVTCGANIAVAQTVDQQVISVGIGLMYTIYGILVIVFGTIYGNIRDAFHSYDGVLYSTFVFQVVGTTLFVVAIIVRKMKPKRTLGRLRGQDNITITIEE